MIRFSSETQAVQICETIDIARPVSAIHRFLFDVRNLPRYVSLVPAVLRNADEPESGEVWSAVVLHPLLGSRHWTARITSIVADQAIVWSASGPSGEGLTAVAELRSLSDRKVEVNLTIDYSDPANNLARRLLAAFRQALLRRLLRVALFRLKRILELTEELSRPWSPQASCNLTCGTRWRAHTESLNDTSDVDAADAWTRRLRVSVD